MVEERGEAARNFLKEFIQFIDLRYKGVLLLDEGNRIVFASSRFYEIFNLYTEDALEGLLPDVFRKYEIDEGTEYFYDRDGHQVNVKHGRFSCLEGLTLSAWVFEVVGMENARKKILENIIQYSQDGIHAVDQSGTLIIYNAAQGKIDHYEPKDVLGKKAVDVYALNEETSLLLKVLKTREPIENLRQSYYTKEGTFVDCVTSVVPLFYHGKIFGSAAIVRDYSAVLHLFSGEGAPSLGGKKGSALHLQGKQTRYTFNDIISISHDVGKCIRTAKQAAGNDSSILVIGETGTGKEMFAQSIHNYSARKGKPFLAINCAAIPETLLESLLFGSTKGAFTGAMDKAGLFEEADGGTVFLDEINSMPILLQAKLLRVLEERAVTRVGSNHLIHVDFRIISSCNENPVFAIRENRIREDLFYRLAVHYVAIPSLRKRKEDIPILSEYFITYFNAELNRGIKDLDPQVKEMFLAYDWPGNVRQLRHVLEASMNMTGTSDDYISVHHLPKYFFNPEESSGEAGGQPSLPGREAAPEGGRASEKGLLGKIKEAEKEQIIKALKQNGGNVAKAARELGMSRQKLYYRIKIYEL